MGLFQKKPPCPICGGKIGWLLPSVIEDQYICNDCFAKIDMDREIQNNLTMQQFREYLVFYEQNSKLKEKFVISERIDFGLWDTKLIFDYDHNLFCLSKNPTTTVFEGKDLVSFVIMEDNTPLFEGSARGVKRYPSAVPQMAMALEVQVMQFMENKKMAEKLAQFTDDEKEKERQQRNLRNMDIKEPFQCFNVELRFKHPYWRTFRCDMTGPKFSNDNPSVPEYLSAYDRDIEELEKLVNALMTVCFPNVGQVNTAAGAGFDGYIQQPTDAAAEIKKYKELLEEGILTEEEFQTKKRQLLGI